MNDSASAASEPIRLPRCAVPVWASLVVGTVLRFLLLGRKPLWEDEGWTFYAATSERSLLDVVGLDPHPLTFYWLARLSRSFITISDWTFRMPSALLATGTLLLWARCLSLLGMGRCLRAWCVLLFAVLPINIRYAHEGRVYALAQFLGVLVLVLYARARRGPTRGRLAALGGATALSCHIDGFGLVMPFGVLLHSAWESRRCPSARRLLATLLVGGALAAPYYIFRLSYILSAGEVHTLPAVDVNPIVLLGQRLVSMSPFGVTSNAVSRFCDPAIPMAGLAIVVIIALIVSIGSPAHWCPRNGRLLFGLCFLPPLAIFLVLCSLTGMDSLETRYLLVLVPGFIPLMVLGGMRLLNTVPESGHALFLLVPLAVSGAWLAQPVARSSSDWRTLFHRISPEMNPEDGYIHEAFANDPLHPISPLRAYAWRSGAAISDEQCREFRTTVERGGPTISLADADHWRSEQEREELIRFVSRRSSGRIWTLSGDLSLGRGLDLQPYAQPAGEWRVAGVRARLWESTRPAPEVQTVHE